MTLLLSDFAYLLMVLMDLVALLLVLEWIFYFAPGVAFNGIRRMLFYLTQPLLAWSDRFFSVRMGTFNLRGLVTALLLGVISYLGLPWLIIYSYSLRGS